MSQISFDTLEYAKAPREAGFSETQAEGLARANGRAFGQMLDTKALATQGGIARLESAMRFEMPKMETRLVKSLHNALYGFAGLIIAAIACAVAILK